jgi:pimeloyl-ACP methyl ester carboxylesterase
LPAFRHSCFLDLHAIFNSAPVRHPSPYKQTTVDNVLLNYLEVKPELPSQKPPLLVLHQLLATAETLTEFIQHLPRDRRIVALDILSAKPVFGPLDTRAKSLALLVAAFAQSIGLAKPVLTGHSHGGALALWLASTEPSDPAHLDVRALALLCPAHPFAGYRSHVVAFYLTRWGRFLALKIPLAPSRLILWAYNQAAGPASPITFAQFKPHLVILRSFKSLARVLDILRTWEADMTDLRNVLITRPIQQPTLILWGDHDTVVPPESSAALEQHLARNQRTTLPGRGHLLPQEASAECAQLICGWLESSGV